MILEMTDHGLIAPVADPEAALDRGADVLRAHTKAIAAVLDAGRKPCRQRNGLPPPYVYRGREPVEQMVDRVRRLTSEHRQQMALEMGPYLPAGRARIAEGSEVFDAVVKYNAEQAERLLRGRRKTISGTR